eukprot:gb/GECG01014425.1/.p1 GENE.gb/GECG01014425.1/~~gb/GECG01014425.1/.p1  ORF type:complete len:754 (+),score=74.97 gb/GECG01014425.1/:1-2262(+)
MDMEESDGNASLNQQESSRRRSSDDAGTHSDDDDSRQIHPLNNQEGRSVSNATEDDGVRLTGTAGNTRREMSQPDLPHAERITVRVKTLDDTIFEVTCCSSSTIEEFKRVVRSRTELSIARQRLIFQGRQLQNNDTLDSYSVRNGATLHLVARPASAVGETSNAATSNNVTSSAANQPLSEATTTPVGTQDELASDAEDAVNPVDFTQLISVAGSLGRITDALTMRGGQRQAGGRLMVPTNNGNMVIDAPGGVIRPDGGVVPVMQRDQPVRRCPGPAFETRTAADSYAVMRDRLVAADAMDAIHGAWGRQGHGQDGYLYYSADSSSTSQRSAEASATLAESLRPLDPLWQNIMTMETVASAVGWNVECGSSREPGQVCVRFAQHQLQPTDFNESKHQGQHVAYSAEQPHDTYRKYISSLPRSYKPANGKPRRRFLEGQWVDVCDTVQKWLEATIMKISEDGNQAFIHYNGWPERWDEWINVDSPRIAPFRTRTTHALESRSCPVPVTICRESPVLPVNFQSLDKLIPYAVPYAETTTNMLCRFGHLINATSSNTAKRTVRREAMASESEDNLEGVLDDLQGPPPSWEGAVEWKRSDQDAGAASQGDIDESPGTRKTRTETRQACFEAPSSTDIRSLAQQLAPMLDRLGRFYIDLSAHVQNIANSFPSEDSLETARAQRALSIAFGRMVRSVRRDSSEAGDNHQQRNSRRDHRNSFMTTSSRPSTASSFFSGRSLCPQRIERARECRRVYPELS